MTSTARIPVLVVGGYLGAGKTTFINNVLRKATQRIAVVVNDFGSINIDAALISGQHDDTIELTNGCICCSVGESLADVLYTILEREQRPELVIIEASGVADPGSVAAFAHIGGLHHLGNLVLIDALNALSTAQNTLIGKMFQRQVASAHLLALSKTDVAEVDVTAEILHLLANIAPHTQIVDISSFALAELMTAEIRPVNESPHADHTVFTTMTIDYVTAKTEDQLRTYIDNFPSTVVRAKGIVQLEDGTRRLIQRVGSHLSVQPTELDATGLVIISIG